MSEVVTKNDLAKILSLLPFLKLSLTNLVNGSADGSVRGINTETEYSSYTIGKYAFAEGFKTKASGNYSHAEGGVTTARGEGSHAEGYFTTANGSYSHSQNFATIASKTYQTVIGKYNLEDTESNESNQKAFIIGNGTSHANRSNGFTVDWNGEVEMALDISATSGTDKEIYNALVALGWDSDVIG